MLGLALEGGGARGAFHMGTLKALTEEGYHFEGVAGTSIGALNGAIIAQGDFEAGYRMWENLDNSMTFEMEENQIRKILERKLDRETRAVLTAKIKDIIENRGIDTSGIRKLLNGIIDEEKLRRSSVDFGIVTVSISDLKPLELYKEDIPAGKLIDYLMASANYPTFKIEPIDGKFYMDGGFYDNCPANLLIRKGYRDIVIIRTFAKGILRKLEDENVNVIRIIPSEDLGSILNFDHETIMANLKMGYYDAKRVVKHLKGRKYYLVPVDDSLIMNSLLSVPDKIIEEIGNIMQFPPMDPKRMLFERIIPELSNMLKLPAASTYQDIVIGALEYYAEEQGLDKYKIRSFGDFLEELKRTGLKKESTVNLPLLSLLPLKKSRSMILKESIIKDAALKIIHVMEPRCFN
jgi:NTE family protein